MKYIIFLIPLLLILAGCVENDTVTPEPVNPQPPATDFCGEPNVASVHECLGGTYQVVSSLLGGGSTFYKSDGTSFTCPIVAPEYMSAECKEIIEGDYCEQENLCKEDQQDNAYADDERIAQKFVLNSPTYLYDGIYDTFESKGCSGIKCPGCGVICTFTFDSRYGGYGDRTDMMLIQVITPHRADILVQGEEVTSAIMDQKWDMLKQEMVEEPCLSDEDCNADECTKMYPNPKCKQGECACIAGCETDTSCNYLNGNYTCIDGECVNA